eukprot:2975127-Rhodomonas_salina.1
MVIVADHNDSGTAEAVAGTGLQTDATREAYPKTHTRPFLCDIQQWTGTGIYQASPRPFTAAQPTRARQS